MTKPLAGPAAQTAELRSPYRGCRAKLARISFLLASAVQREAVISEMTAGPNLARPPVCRIIRAFHIFMRIDLASINLIKFEAHKNIPNLSSSDDAASVK